MSIKKGYCEICGTEIEVRICCNSFDCGCMGLPVDPPVCSNECYGKLMEKYSNKPTNPTQPCLNLYHAYKETNP